MKGERQRKECIEEERWERMTKGRSERNRAEEETAPGSHNANTLQSIAAKRWDQLVNAEERSGSGKWQKRLASATYISERACQRSSAAEQAADTASKEKGKQTCRRCVQCGRWSHGISSKVIKLDTGIKSVVFILWTFDKQLLNALFKVVSASHTACLISLFSFGSNSLNMAEMRKKELMGEIMELTCNLSIYQCVDQAHIYTFTPTHTPLHKH